MADSNLPKKPSAKKTAPEKQTLAVYFSTGSFLTLSDDNNQWINESIPCTLDSRGWSIAIAHLSGVNAIIVAGGNYYLESLSSVEMFDFTTKTWTEQPPMSTKRAHSAGVCLPDGTTFLVCGGGGNFNNGNHFSCEQFNSIARTWSPVADMSTPRMRHSIVLYRGVPVALGGWVESTLNTCEQYNIADDTWLPFPSFDVPRSQFGAAVVLDKIYIAGGYDAAKDCAIRHTTVEVYDGTSWSILPSGLPSSFRYGHAAACFQDKLVVVGGCIGHVDVYDPIDNTWLDSYYPQIDILLFCHAVVF